MKDQKKAKWILGTSGVVLSAVILTQMNDRVDSEEMNDPNLSKEQIEKMSEREKELVQLDWTSFEVIGVQQQQEQIQVDRKTKRS